MIEKIGPKALKKGNRTFGGAEGRKEVKMDSKLLLS